MKPSARGRRPRFGGRIIAILVVIGILIIVIVIFVVLGAGTQRGAHLLVARDRDECIGARAAATARAAVAGALVVNHALFEFELFALLAQRHGHGLGFECMVECGQEEW